MDVPLDVASEFQDTLVNNNFSIKAMVRAMVLSDDFGTSRVLSDPDGSVFSPGIQVIRPEQYSRTLNDLTGFRWLANQDSPTCQFVAGNACWNTVDLLDSDLYGFRSMQGGIDGYTVTSPIHSPTPTKALAMAMAADEAAGWVVASDFEVPAASRKLLQLVEADTSSEAEVRGQLVWLHERILGEFLDANSPEVDLSYGLWSGVYIDTQDPLNAWEVTISALLQDPRMVFY